MAYCITTCRCKGEPLSLVQVAVLILYMAANTPSCFSLGGGRIRCIERERRALLNIEKDLYDPGDWLSSWRKGGDCCSWLGVECDNVTGHVVELDLQYPYLQDDDADDGSSGAPLRASKLNPSLMDLTHLEYLDLSGNNFSGAPFPEYIGSLLQLEYLDLSSTWFYGTVPHQLGNLSSLQVLIIDYGYDPPSFILHVDDLHWLSRLTSLYYLRLSAVDLSKAVDWIYDISKLPNLSTLELEYAGLLNLPTSVTSVSNFTFLSTISFFGNQFNSTIPSWLLNNISSLVDLSIGNSGLYGELPLTAGDLINLQSLDLGRNKFGAEIWKHFDSLPYLRTVDLAFNVIDGPIPDSLWNLTRLRSIKLDENQIPGSLPKTLGNLSQLQGFSVSGNRLSGEIPESIGNLRNLTDLYLGNNQIRGRIPDSIGNLANLNSFDISTNLITGEIPPSLFNISRLQQLTMSNNSISGYIPNTVSNLYELSILDLSSNRLTGPMFFCNLSSLAYLDLSNNDLYGNLPRFENKSSQLVILNLSNNSLSGHIPDLFGSLPYLGSLHLGSNDLSGKIPESLKHCQQLVTLDLHENRLSGNIPTWIGESLSRLGILSLRSNQLSGLIPTQLSYLTSLQILDLSLNNLTGSLSLRFENFSSMAGAHLGVEDRFFVFHKNLLYVENLQLVTKGAAYDYTSLLSSVNVIDLSSNSLSGEISDTLTQLHGLVYLNLSRNRFTGSIPENIGAMTDLQAIDLSTNSFSGEIPSSVSALHFLGRLNFSNNDLSGEIPQVTQFSTFSASDFSGNRGLCGWPLPKCPGNAPNRNGQEEEEDDGRYEMVWIYGAAAIGFVISFWAAFGTIMIKQSIRILFFRAVDDFSDWIYVKFALSIARLKSSMWRMGEQ